MYRIIRFGTTSLEFTNQDDDIGSGLTPAAFRTLPDGGAVDAYGTTRKRPGAVERVLRRRLTATSATELEALWYGLQALVGTRDRLYRRTPSGRVHWMYARLVDITAARTYEQAKYRYTQDVELRFICLDPYWRGAMLNGWTLDAGYSLDYSERLDRLASWALGPTGSFYTIDLGGDELGMAPVRSVEIVVTPGLVPLQPVAITREGGESLNFTGLVPVGGQLVINSGTMQVSCTGAANPYSTLVIDPTADQANWFSLLPGLNRIQVSYGGAGGGGTVSVISREAWY